MTTQFLDLTEKSALIHSHFEKDARNDPTVPQQIARQLRADLIQSGWPDPRVEYTRDASRIGWEFYVFHRVLVVPAEWPEAELSIGVNDDERTG